MSRENKVVWEWEWRDQSRVVCRLTLFANGELEVSVDGDQRIRVPAVDVLELTDTFRSGGK